MSTHFQGLGYICLLKIHILKNQFFVRNSSVKFNVLDQILKNKAKKMDRRQLTTNCKIKPFEASLPLLKSPQQSVGKRR